MTDRLYTMSGAARAHQCPGHAALPHVRSTSTHADDGIAVHRYCAPPHDLTAVPEHLKARCQGIALDHLPSGRSEVALAWHVPSGRGWELPTSDHRLYPRALDTLYGTADILHVTADTVEVWDLKTGPLGAARTTPPERNHQLRGLAVMAASTHHKDRARVGLTGIGPDGEICQTEATMDAFDLAAEADLMARSAANIRAQQARAVPDVTEGPECRYCPAALACPAKTGWLQRLANDPAGVADGLINALSRDGAAVAYRRWQHLRETLGRVGSALHAYAAEHPIELEDGMVFGPAPGRESLDGAVVHSVVAQMHGPEVALQAVGLSATKSGVERALRAAGLKVAPELRRVLTAVREVGGAIVGADTVREHRKGVTNES